MKIAARYRASVGLRILVGVLAVLCAVACSPSPSPTPAATASTQATATTAPSRSPTPGATASQQATATTATSYYAATKNGEGPHGGAPLIDLPVAAIAIDYDVSGRCVFTVGLRMETSAAGLPSLTMSVTGPAVTGTWRLSIKPGRYYVDIGEAVGCVFSVDVRDDR